MESPDLWSGFWPALLGALIGGATTWYLQNEAHKEQRRLLVQQIDIELFDRRMRIYDAVVAFISQMQSAHGPIDSKVVDSVLSQTREAIYLFPTSQIHDFIRNLYEMANQLNVMRQRSQTQMESILRKEEEFRISRHAVDSIFRPYLHIGREFQTSGCDQA